MQGQGKTAGAASIQDRLLGSWNALGERVWQRENREEGFIRLYALRLLRLAWIMFLESKRDQLTLPAAPKEELRSAEIVGVVLGERASTPIHPLAREILRAAKETARNREIKRSPPPGDHAREEPIQMELFSEKKR